MTRFPPQILPPTCPIRPNRRNDRLSQGLKALPVHVRLLPQALRVCGQVMA